MFDGKPDKRPKAKGVEPHREREIERTLLHRSLHAQSYGAWQTPRALAASHTPLG